MLELGRLHLKTGGKKDKTPPKTSSRWLKEQLFGCFWPSHQG
jgi:hypothetical protein